MKYEVIDYFDVWGNDKDGYEVNDYIKVGTVELDKGLLLEDILEALQDLGLLNTKDCSQYVSIEGDDEFIELFIKANRYPLCQLIKVKGE